MSSPPMDPSVTAAPATEEAVDEMSPPPPPPPEPVDFDTIVASIPTTASPPSTTTILYMPAEWAYHSACLILFPHNSQTFRLSKVEKEIISLAKSIVQDGKEDVYLLCKDPDHQQQVQTLLLNSSGDDFDDGWKLNTAARNTIRLEVCASNDTWVRDTGPTFVWQQQQQQQQQQQPTVPVPSASSSLVGLHWNFNAYGGPIEGCYWPCTEDQAVGRNVCTNESMIKQLTIGGHYSIPIILEGGSIHTDGEGTLLTTEECLCNPNRNPQLQRHQIEQILQLCLHVQKVIWLPTGLDADDDTNGHIDNFCCFVQPGHVVLAWTDDDVHDVENYQRCRQAEQVLVSTKDAKGRSFTITKLYLPSPPLRYTKEEALSLAIKSTEEEQGGPNDRTVDTDDDKKTKYIMVREPNEKMAASYVNFYIANEAILVPQFGKDAVITDRQACETLQGVFPDRKVVGVPSREILLGGGNIHCQTQQVPALK